MAPSHNVLLLNLKLRSNLGFFAPHWPVATRWTNWGEIRHRRVLHGFTLACQICPWSATGGGYRSAEVHSVIKMRYLGEFCPAGRQYTLSKAKWRGRAYYRFIPNLALISQHSKFCQICRISGGFPHKMKFGREVHTIDAVLREKCPLIVKEVKQPQTLNLFGICDHPFGFVAMLTISS